MLALQGLEVAKEVVEKASKIKLVLMDVDGVLTDGRLYYLNDESGKAHEFKSFSSQDGVGVFLLGAAGIKTGVISGRVSEATEERARILKMSHVYQGHMEKMAIYDEILGKESLTADNVAFIGDDFPDAPLIRRSGLGCAVGDARPEVQAVADFVSNRPGGQGAVREIAELILKASGKWEGVLERFSLV